MRWGHEIRLKGGPDDPHIEWTGPGPKPTPSEFKPGQLAAGTREAAAVIDRSRAMTHRVEGTGKLSVDVSAPHGTSVQAEGGGLFKRTEMHRKLQMAPAHPGAGQGPTAAVAGHGTAL